MKRLLLLMLFTARLWGQAPALTTVQDTFYRPLSAAPFAGTVRITPQGFTSADARAVVGTAESYSLPAALAGVGCVELVPNTSSSPSGTSYQVQFYGASGQPWEETWIVPASTPVAAPAAPTSVTQAGTPGSTTYYYFVSATNATGETRLGPGTVTTTSAATLNGTDYNVISWDAVSGATGYRVWRSSTATPPAAGATGLHLVGSTAGTTINDQSNTLNSATVPACNDTDPVLRSAVLVTRPPSPSIQFNPTQVIGTAVVEDPLATQTITAPVTSGTPLELKGRSGNTDNVLEVYDNAETPALKYAVNASGLPYFEGATSDGVNITTFSVADPTAPRTITVPNADSVLVVGDSGASNNFLTAVNPSTGAISKAQPAFSDLSGTATGSQLPIIVDTADQGYFLGVQVFPAASSDTTASVTAIDQTRVFQFVLPFRVTVGNIVSRVTTGGGAGTFYGIGLYSAAGSLVLETGALDANTVAINKTAITPVTLAPGAYFFAWTSDSTSTALSAFVVTSGGATDAILNAGSVEKVGTANASAAGVLPASMGTISALSIASIPLVSFER